jgi:hypothetical protein
MHRIVPAPAPGFIDWRLKIADSTLEIMDRTMKNSPELFGLAEDDLMVILEEKRQKPNSTTRMLRVRLWDLYQESGSGRIQTHLIHQDICYPSYWEACLRDPYKLAFILTPVSSFLTHCDTMIVALMKSLQDVAYASALDPRTKKIDLKTAKLQYEMLQYFDQRKNGAIVQKVEQTNRSMSINIDGKLPEANREEIAQMVASMDVKELEAKLLEMKTPKLPPVDVADGG